MGLPRILSVLALGGAALLCAKLAVADPAVESRAIAPQGLAAYRAVYQLSLSDASLAAGGAGGRGRLSFNLSGSSCQGYQEIRHQVTELRTGEGAPQLLELRSATFETADGNGFDFDFESKSGGAAPKSVKGKAKKTSGSGLAVTLGSAKRRDVDLGGDALFPAEYLKRTLAAAHNDEKIFRAKVFDGSGQGNPVLDASTVIGKPSTAPATEKALKIQQLEGLRHWPVTVSYFQPDAPDSTPLYVKTYELYENGVVHVLKIDYGHLVVAGEVTELVLTPPAKACK
jgi:EipB-like